MPQGPRRFPVPFEVLLQSSTDLLSVHRRDGSVVYANAATKTLLGITPEEFVRGNPFRLVHPDDRHALIAQMAELGRRPGAVQAFALRARHADGSYRDLEVLARNGLDDPDLQGVLLSTRDVTDRARAEATLRASESRHRQLVEGVPIGLAVVDRDGLLRFANPCAQGVVGVELVDLLGRTVTDFLHPDDRDRCAEAVRLALVDRVVPGAAEYQLVRPDGVDCVVASTPMPYEWEGAPAALLMLQDVTALHRAERQRVEAADRLSRILDATADGIVGIDHEGRITFMNPAAARTLGLDAQAVLGLDGHALYHHSRADGSPYPEAECPAVQAMRSGRSAEVSDEVLWRSDGTPVPVEYRATPLPANPAPGAVLTFHDISERVRARERLTQVAAFQRAVLDALPSLTAVVDQHGVIVAVNQAWTRHAEDRGGDPALCGVGVPFLGVCDAAGGEFRAGAQAAATGLRALLAGERETHEQDVPCRQPDGSTAHFSLLMVPLRGVPQGGVVIAYTDITARKQLEVDAAHRATHDVLTGLPNRTLLLERLEHALETRGEPAIALLFLDLDGFKLVNDGYGHEAGDTVLTQLADRLRHHVRPSDTVARLSGDEFVVLCEQLGHPTEAHVLAERLIAAVGQPFAITSTTVSLGVSIGIAVASEPHTGPDALLRAADQAMFDAKARGRNRFTVYDAGVHGRHHVRLEQAMALRRLVDDDDLLVHYQPVVDLRTGELRGAEALLRWRGEVRLPDTATAISLGEEIGLIGRIGRFVLREAISQAATFRRPDGTPLPVAVNLAPQQLDRRLVGLVEQAAEAAGYPLSSVTLELTERTVMSDPRLAVEVLQALRDRGVRIALDDFGVGYSSLAALNSLPLDVLKIDAGFVRGLGAGGQDGRIITAIVELARVLGLEIVAEGIEHQEQRDRLIELGCETGQGWLYSKARPAEVLRRLSA
ncbi:MAG: domain S-box-containing protein/diguanylate cyclase protein [Frankiales bacterium]|nr:domain S-box-containing protein/diguanylate cyclase protein [Frankiales bacterium]